MINPTVFAKATLPWGFTFRIDYTPRFSSRKRFDFDEKGHPQTAVDEGRRRHNESFKWQWNNILNWDKEFGNHRFAVTGLYNAEKSENWFTDSRTSNFSPTASLGYHGMNFGLNPLLIQIFF